MCSVVLIYGSSNFRLAARGVLVAATPLTEVTSACFGSSLRFATACDGGRLAAVVVGDEDMPDELGAFVAGAVTGGGGGFILGTDEGVVERGRVEVRVVAIVLSNGVGLVSIYFHELSPPNVRVDAARSHSVTTSVCPCARRSLSRGHLPAMS